MRIPFDRLCVKFLCKELQAVAGAKVQEVRALGDSCFELELYVGSVQRLLVSFGRDTFRMHLTAMRRTKVEPSHFVAEVRRRLKGTRLTEVKQIGSDRVVELSFDGADGRCGLRLEFLGRHTNAILLDSNALILGAAHLFSERDSIRPIQPNRKLPPLHLEGLSDSPFARKLAAALGLPDLESIPLAPHLSDAGAYPVDFSTLESSARPSLSFSQALDSWYGEFEANHEFRTLQDQLRGQLNRVLAAREKAAFEIERANESIASAEQWQVYGQLLYSYQHSIAPGVPSAQVFDFAGQTLVIELNPELTVQENAEWYFDKAKRAKRSTEEVVRQGERIQSDLAELRILLHHVELAPDLDDLLRSKAVAEANRWLRIQSLPKAKEERPFEGKRVREILGPSGYRILYGENAEANDYLTLRVGKPNDFWLHVRGSTSAHVVISTHNAPDKVPIEVIRYAAEVAARHSGQKHSSYVPVDYTLKKYVRRIKGGSLGTVQYSHEKTLHVDPKTN